jgi:hypothetical protein
MAILLRTSANPQPVLVEDHSSLVDFDARDRLVNLPIAGRKLASRSNSTALTRYIALARALFRIDFDR